MSTSVEGNSGRGKAHDVAEGQSPPKAIQGTSNVIPSKPAHTTSLIEKISTVISGVSKTTPSASVTYSNFTANNNNNTHIMDNTFVKDGSGAYAVGAISQDSSSIPVVGPLLAKKVKDNGRDATSHVTANNSMGVVSIPNNSSSHSHVAHNGYAEADEEELIHMGAAGSPSNVEKYDFGTNENGFRRTFPEKLMEILNLEETADAMQWTSDGEAFIIVSVANCVHNILPRFFKQTKFASFIRKVNRWGFKQISKGTRNIVYRHPNFKRGQLELCMAMRCSSEAASTVVRKNPSQSNPKVQYNPSQQMPMQMGLHQMGMSNKNIVGMNYSSSTAPPIAQSQLQHHQHGMMPAGNQQFNPSVAIAVQSVPQGQQPNSMPVNGMMVSPMNGMNMGFTQMPQIQQSGMMVPQMMTSNSNMSQQLQQPQQLHMGQGFFPQQQMGMHFLNQGQTVQQAMIPQQPAMIPQQPAQGHQYTNIANNNGIMTTDQQSQQQQFMQMQQNFIPQQQGNFPTQQHSIMMQGNANNSVANGAMIPPHMAMFGQQVQCRTENTVIAEVNNNEKDSSANLSSSNGNGMSTTPGQQVQTINTVDTDTSNMQIKNFNNNNQNNHQFVGYPQMQFQTAQGQWQQQGHAMQLQQPQFPVQPQQQFGTPIHVDNSQGGVSSGYSQQQPPLPQQQQQQQQQYWGGPV